MRKSLLLPLFFLIACAHAPERNIASFEVITLGEVDSTQSSVRLFPNTTGHPDLHHFYLELRNSNNKLVDIELNDISLKLEKNSPSIYLKRISVGRYQMEVSDHIPHFKKLKFVVQNKIIKYTIVRKQKPVKANSKIKLISNTDNKLKFHVYLNDEKNSVVILETSPDIILDGLGGLSKPFKLEDGAWEFVIDYPEMNQVLYISIRANGIMLEKLYRHQHIEKSQQVVPE
jgi:hypothetical protein